MEENRVGDRHPVVRVYRTGSASAPEAEPPPCFGSTWISDFHPGTKSSGALLDFLRSHYAEILYLAGDIVDGWNSGRWWWSPAQNAMVREIVNWGRRRVRASLSSVISRYLMGGQAHTLAFRLNDCYRHERFKLDRRPLRTYLKRVLSKAASGLTVTRFDEVRP